MSPPPLIRVKDHRHVLPHWAQKRVDTNQPLRLITLDCHTDTCVPFRRRKFPPQKSASAPAQLLRTDYSQTAAVHALTSQIENNEHILAALEIGAISDGVIVAHRTADLDLYSQHRLIFRKIDNDPKAPDLASSGFNSVIEAEFLERKINEVDQILTQHHVPKIFETPYILDIDLDYFRTHRSYQPQDASFFKLLGSRACLVTIAMEPDYVQSCAIEPGLSSEKIFASLRQILSSP